LFWCVRYGSYGKSSRYFHLEEQSVGLSSGSTLYSLCGTYCRVTVVFERSDKADGSTSEGSGSK
jgi:hypothetical protein